MAGKPQDGWPAKTSRTEDDMRSLIIGIILALLAVLVIAGPLLESLMDRVILPRARAGHRHDDRRDGQ
jgi:hypothetical protein